MKHNIHRRLCFLLSIGLFLTGCSKIAASTAIDTTNTANSSSASVFESEALPKADEQTCIYLCNDNGTHTIKNALHEEFEEIVEGCNYDASFVCKKCGYRHKHEFTDYVSSDAYGYSHIKGCECGYIEEEECTRGDDYMCTVCKRDMRYLVESISPKVLCSVSYTSLLSLPSFDGTIADSLFEGEQVVAVGIVTSYKGSPCSYYRLDNGLFASTNSFVAQMSFYSTNRNPNLLSAGLEYIPVGANYYCLYNTNAVTVSYYNHQKQLIDTKEYAPSTTGQYLLFDCNYIQVDAGPSDYLMTTGIARDLSIQSGNSFYVISNNSPIPFAISTAVTMARENGLVLVLPGGYIDTIKSWGKAINIAGLNREQTIIANYTGDYRTPPIEIGPGSLSNLTVRALGEKSWDHGSYAVHIEDNYLTDKSVTISNCTMSSDSNWGLGLGLRRGSINIYNCFVTSCYVHDSDDEKYGGTQFLTIYDSSFEYLLLQSLEKPSSNIWIDIKNSQINKLETNGSRLNFAK